VRTATLAAFGLALAICPVAVAAPGKVAVGIAEGVSADVVASLAVSATGGTVDDGLEELDALVVTVPDVEAALDPLAALPGVDYVEPVVRSRALAFQPNDPLVFFQWYLNAVRAFDFWETRPDLGLAVRVAVVDSGIDAEHPEFQGRIAGTHSFVKSKATVDSIGHGTTVAGEIAAALDNAEGIAGVGFPVELLVAKVVSDSGTISVQAEAEAIKWAVDNEAQVINLSLGGFRDPSDPTRDTYSALEQAAINYAYEHGAVVVAATGNSNPGPYRYASYPAALPHVLGVSALNQAHKTPAFSNRDAIFNDLAAPGVEIVSTFPTKLTDPVCAWPGYNICAVTPNGGGTGTSFSAPLATAAAALLLAQRPSLTASQVMTLLEKSAADIGTAGRDALTGNGLLDVADALAAALTLAPPADRFEVNDDAGSEAHTIYGSKRHRVNATIDAYDDPSDVYRVYLRAGRNATFHLDGPQRRRPTLALWRPGTKHVTPITAIAVRTGAVLAFRGGVDPRFTYRVPRSGWYFVEVKAPKAGGGAYELTIIK
jgi:subtilisin family serine protease